MGLIDKDALQASLEPLLQEAVTKAATDLIARELPIEKVKRAIDQALQNYFGRSNVEAAIETGLELIVNSSVRAALENTGFKTTVQQLVDEYIQSEEYQQLLRHRVIDSINKTTIYVRPATEES